MSILGLVVWGLYLYLAAVGVVVVVGAWAVYKVWQIQFGKKRGER